jgi:sigma-B regulation protein RsbU (phosphoserine phosphatase)
MADVVHGLIREQLIDRRRKLREARKAPMREARLEQLIEDVDAALRRLDEGTYGLCRECQEPIETDRLMADPLLEFCLSHLTAAQQHALEEDLNMASRIQSALLPPRKLRSQGWEVAYHYEGASPVSGDYCDLLASEEGVSFVVGDVMGKGVAASMLSAHLHATFRALFAMGLPLADLVTRASRAFCESTLPTHFATIVYGRADRRGGIEICNAGHHPPLIVRHDTVMPIEATGLPLGLFCDATFTLGAYEAKPGDVLLLYTDGLCEAQDGSGREYGTDRLVESVRGNAERDVTGLIGACIADYRRFLGGRPQADDLTLMALRRLATGE